MDLVHMHSSKQLQIFVFIKQKSGITKVQILQLQALKGHAVTIYFQLEIFEMFSDWPKKHQYMFCFQHSCNFDHA